MFYKIIFLWIWNAVHLISLTDNVKGIQPQSILQLLKVHFLWHDFIFSYYYIYHVRTIVEKDKTNSTPLFNRLTPYSWYNMKKNVLLFPFLFVISETRTWNASKMSQYSQLILLSFLMSKLALIIDIKKKQTKKENRAGFIVMNFYICFICIFWDTFYTKILI